MASLVQQVYGRSARSSPFRYYLSMNFSTAQTPEPQATNSLTQPDKKSIPKYYDTLRMEGKSKLSPQRLKELAEIAREKSIQAKSKSRKFYLSY